MLCNDVWQAAAYSNAVYSGDRGGNTAEHLCSAVCLINENKGLSGQTGKSLCKCQLFRIISVAAALFLKGEAVGAFGDCGVGFVCTNLYAVQ